MGEEGEVLTTILETALELANTTHTHTGRRAGRSYWPNDFFFYTMDP